MTSRHRVLIVEDNRPLAENIAEILEDYDVDALIATNVDEALGLVDDRLSGVITDLRLPGRSGIDLIRELRAGGVKVPVVIVSAFADAAAVEAAESVGALDVLPKPIDVSRLVSLVGELSQPRQGVLIVEDSAAFADNVAQLAEEMGLRAVIAPTVRAALDNRWLPSVALVDLALPDGSGIDVARVLCARDPELKVLVMTGVPESARPSTDLPNVESPVLEKPVDVGALVHKMRELARRCQER